MRMVSTSRTSTNHRQTSQVVNAVMYGEKSTTVFGGLMILAAIHSLHITISHNGYSITIAAICILAIATAALNVSVVTDIGRICTATDKEAAQSIICLSTAVPQLV